MLKYVTVFTLLIFGITFQNHLTAQDLSGIRGTITDQDIFPLPGANILLVGTNKGTSTDVNGNFKINGLSTGSYELRISYLGYETVFKEINVPSDEARSLSIKMTETSVGNMELVVRGDLTKGQAKALNQQKNASNITYVVSSEVFEQYPDVSAAETVQRFPGVSIVRDQGEGEFVQIRGLSEDFNSLTIDGLRIPSMEGDDTRGVGLDLIQTKLIENIKVTKTLTPDMDADALGGAVDFQLKKAGNRPEFELQLTGGLNEQESVLRDKGRDIFGVSAIGGFRFADNKIGVMAGGSYFNTDRGSLFSSWRYANETGDELRRHRATDYDINRERYGIIANVDFQASDASSFELLFNHNTYIDDEIRRQTRFLLEDDREERRTRNRDERQFLSLVKLTGNHALGSRVDVTYSGSWSEGKEKLPDRTESRFRRDVTFSGLSNQEIFELEPDFVFPDNDTPLEFTRMEFDPRRTEERNLTFSTDLTFNTDFAERTVFKAGGKFIDKNRDFFQSETRFQPLQEILVDPNGTFGLVDVRFGDSTFNQLFADPTSANDPLEDPGSYFAEEQIFAGYFMGETFLSDQWSALTGVRIENTDNNYLQFSTSNTGNGGFTTILPSFHLNWEPAEGFKVRGAVTKGFARPNYTNLVPIDVVDNSDFEISRGNTDLDPTITWNYDLTAEKFTRFLGHFSAGVFYKDFRDPVVTQSFTEVINGQEFVVFQPQNSGSADLLGFELASRQNLSVLNIDALKWFGVTANYTYIYTNTEFGSTEGQNLPLPNSPSHIASGSFTYDNGKNGLSLVLAGVYRSSVFSKFEGGDDIWLDETFHLDFSARYSLNNSFNLFMNLNNITNESNTEINREPGTSQARIHENERYGLWTTAGIQYNF